MPDRLIPNSHDLKHRSARGNVVESYIMKHIHCRICLSIDWTNLNTQSKNYASVDLCCNNCGLYVQSKGREMRPNNKCPLTNLSHNNSWDIVRMPCSKNIRQTLNDNRYKKNLCYYYVFYNNINGSLVVHSVATSPVITTRDIDEGENAIISRETLWYL